MIALVSLTAPTKHICLGVFVPFIVVTTFAVMNLLVGSIVNSMQDAHHEDEHAEVLAHRDELMLRLDVIEKKLDRLFKRRLLHQ